MLFFFFFSSRRRHTRYWRDWSSDVCSSDLLHAPIRDYLTRTTPKPDDMKPQAYARMMNARTDRKSTRLNSSHANTSYAVFCLKKKITVTEKPLPSVAVARRSCPLIVTFWLV